MQNLNTRFVLTLGLALLFGASGSAAAAPAKLKRLSSCQGLAASSKLQTMDTYIQEGLVQAQFGLDRLSSAEKLGNAAGNSSGGASGSGQRKSFCDSASDYLSYSKWRGEAVRKYSAYLATKLKELGFAENDPCYSNVRAYGNLELDPSQNSIAKYVQVCGQFQYKPPVAATQ